ncbi:hypothetical protein NL676_000986 [Syzygium grande]|nr:hypothetical protein NL676_000986 [Syzygium grande]
MRLPHRRAALHDHGRHHLPRGQTFGSERSAPALCCFLHGSTEPAHDDRYCPCYCYFLRRRCYKCLDVPDITRTRSCFFS